MLDTVMMHLTSIESESCLGKLSEVKETRDRATGEVYNRGKLHNLMVTVKPGHISIFGSVAKFHFGNNIQTLTRRDVQTVIESLSDRLGLTMSTASIYRCDVGYTFEVKRPVQEYWLGILTPSRMKRIEYGQQSLTFVNRKKAILFYDKQAESRKTKGNLKETAQAKPCTNFLAQANLLRFEVQFRKRLRKTFARQEIR